MVLENVERRPSTSNRIAFFWFTMAVANLLWTALPHVLMSLKTDDVKPNDRFNTTHYPPLSRIGKSENYIIITVIQLDH